ncbi:hypothetical protein BP5796_12049 [Coleophoma crateriformis]|uniref:DUF6594 domain-containing protein n=1 Tax=Coleophoma crateriformis TaxID=565419 RepID=A0A3D8QBA2_9HELO|nr:hypothetical protein BP5796_12049 [Coleophoma crateriformis]
MTNELEELPLHTIYRRIDELAARNLIFYQAELAELGPQQKVYDEEDRLEKDFAIQNCQRNWNTFEAAAEIEESQGALGRENKKTKLALKIWDKLEKYYAALVAHQLLLNNQAPSRSTLTAMRNWFFNNTSGVPGGEKTAQLWGVSKTIFDDPHDLVALRVPAD